MTDLTDIYNNDFICLGLDSKRDLNNKRNHSGSELLFSEDDESYQEWSNRPEE